MAESIARCLKDGSLEGEHAPALTIIDSLRCPLACHVFDHFLLTLLARIASNSSQARGLVIVAFDRSPRYYLDLVKRRGLEVGKWVRVLDCYSDPLGWRRGSVLQPFKENVTVFKDVRDISKLCSSIIDLGNGFVGEGGVRFTVAIDLVSTMLRHVSLPSVAGLINNLRSNNQVSCVFWSIHSDLHQPRAVTALEYLSSMVANLEPLVQYTDEQRGPRKMHWLDENSLKAKLHVRLKRRNGRVKQLYEELHVEDVGVKFSAMSPEEFVINKNLLPKVQFNLQLTDKERIDRANVVLPFEHQGNGEDIHIYDGRRSLTGDQKSSYGTETPDNSIRGEIHYVRDSDDERPDSDEDPDDDLDI